MRTLILVDIQNDFLPGGALAVPRGDEVIPIANELQPRFDLVVAPQDWHPTGHYCVKFSALDARRLGFRTFLVEDGSRGVELQPGDVTRAIEQMRAAGVEVVRSAAVHAS